MARNSVRGTALLLLALAGCEGWRARSSPRSPGPARNLVLILIDTLRQDHLAAYGYRRETAPTLTRLASEGAAVDGLSPTSWTKPAVATLLTGLHPLRHQTVGMRDRLPEKARTLAEILKEKGYVSIAVTANGFSANGYGMTQGFDESAYMQDLGYGPFASAEHVEREALSRLGSLRIPFFLFVHYLDPHAPYEPPAWGASLLTRPRAPIAIQDLEMPTLMTRPRDFLEDAADLYDGEIVRVDRSIGRLLAALEAKGLMESTLTVVVSDHGEEFEEHGRMGHGQTLYDEVLRVPLIFHYPRGVPAGTRHGLASLMDVVPTVLDLLGAGGAAPAVDGRSIADFLWTGRRHEPGQREFVLHLDVGGCHFLGLRRGGEMVVLGRYPHLKELFDLVEDPAQVRNRLPLVTPSSFEALSARLAALHNELVAHALPRAVSPEGVDREAIAALGYVDAGASEARGIPVRIGPPPDAEPGGLLGWEEPRSFKTCLDLASPAAGQQLLEGWYPADEGGRWSGPSATALLVPPRGGRRVALRVTGTKRDAASARLVVSLGEERLIDESVPGGPFSFSGSTAGRPIGSVARVRIERAPAFVPGFRGAIHGRRDATPDHRSLGHFLTSICLEDAPAAGGASP
ncbi:MAG: sulfatase-like hydrolase/transferase [Acidobacteria bacterium]|nr:sulfatase-like hydrolase/transferase [Acidobacteriota bacterium]